MAARDPIRSRHNPLVARFRAAARGEDRSLVLLDGPHLVAEALRASGHIRHALVDERAAGRPEIADLVGRLRDAGIEPTLASSTVIEAASPVRSPTGIVALADRPAIDGSLVYAGDRPLVLIAVNVQDPGNLGAMTRVAEAAGATGLVAAGACADPFAWKALRGSMGSALRLPIVADADVAHAVNDARQHACAIVATVPREGERLFDVDLTGAVAVLVGGEGPGLSPETVASADVRVTIPMQSPVESLNAAVTAALILYEACRQRTAGRRA